MDKEMKIDEKIDIAGKSVTKQTATTFLDEKP